MTTRTIPLSASHASLHRPVHQRHRTASDGPTPWSVVCRRQVGLLRYARGRGVVSLAVPYATWGQRILIRLPVHSDAHQFLDGADVALDIDASTAGWQRVTRVTGVAVVAPDRLEPAGPALDSDPTGPLTTTVVVVPESVSWLPQVDDVRYPPLPGDTDRMPATFAD